MKVTCFNQIKLDNIQAIFPAVRRFDALKMDGLVRRNQIVAVSNKEHGLQFTIPTPASFLDVWQLPQQPQGDFDPLKVLDVPKRLPLDYTDGFLQQIAETCGINRGDLIREAERFPHIAAERINAWLHDEEQLNEGRKRLTSVGETKHLMRAFVVLDHEYP